MEAARRDDAAGETFHLVDSEPVTQNEFLAACRTAKGAKPVRRVPEGVLLAVAWMFEQLGRILKRPLPLSRYKIRALKPLYPVDVSKAKKILGWTPRTGVRAGLVRTFGGKSI